MLTYYLCKHAPSSSNKALKCVAAWVNIYSTVCMAAMSKRFDKGLTWLQVFFSTKQQHTRPDSFNQLISVFRKLIGQTVCSWLVGTKTCSHTALCRIVWTCLVYGIGHWVDIQYCFILNSCIFKWMADIIIHMCYHWSKLSNHFLCLIRSLHTTTVTQTKDVISLFLSHS